MTEMEIIENLKAIFPDDMLFSIIQKSNDDVVKNDKNNENDENDEK